MAGKPIETLVTQLVEEIIKDSQLTLVDVEYVKERDWYLRVFLDKPGGVDLDDCQEVSGQLAEKLDALDPVRESYILEVSSPGLDRPLKKDSDFMRHIGDKIEISTFAPVNGKKLLVGTLLGLESDEVRFEVDGTAMTLPREKISLVRPHVAIGAGKLNRG